MAIADSNDSDSFLRQNLLDKFDKSNNPRLAVKCVKPCKEGQRQLATKASNVLQNELRTRSPTRASNQDRIDIVQRRVHSLAIHDIPFCYGQMIPW